MLRFKNFDRTMETETIQKNRASSKSQTNRKNFFAMMCFVLLAGVVIFGSCEQNEPEPTIPQNVIELIQSAGLLPEPPEEFNRYEILSPETIRVDTTEDYITEWSCKMVRVSASQNPDEFVMFNPLAAVLWPGNLVQGASLASGVPASIPVTNFRQPGRISLAIVSGDAGGTERKMYRTVDRMSFSAVNQAMNEILRGFEGQGYARYSFAMNVIRSSEELEFALNGRFAGGGASVSTGLSMQSSKEATYILITLRQAYFTMVFDTPAGFRDVFTPDITVDDLRNFTGPGNPITYISSVTYGRIFHLLYRSTASEEQLRAALNATFSGFGKSGGVGITHEHRQTMSQTTATVFQLGGAAEGGITAAMAVDMDQIRTFLEAGMNFDPQNVGAPISYTVKHLKNAQIVRMNSTMEFEIEQCRIVNRTSNLSTVRFAFDQYRVDAALSRNYFGRGHFRMGIQVGIERGQTLINHPEDAVFHIYEQEYDDRLANNRLVTRIYQIPLSEQIVQIPKNRSFYIRFQTYTRAFTYWWSILGIAMFHPWETSIGEHRIYFYYNLEKEEWVPRSGNNNDWSLATFNSPHTDRFTFTHTIRYSIEIE